MATTHTTKKKKKFSNFKKALCFDSEKDEYDLDYVDDPNPRSSDTSTSRESHEGSNLMYNATSSRHIEQENEYVLYFHDFDMILNLSYSNYFI